MVILKGGQQKWNSHCKIVPIVSGDKRKYVNNDISSKLMTHWYNIVRYKFTRLSSNIVTTSQHFQNLYEAKNVTYTFIHTRMISIIWQYIELNITKSIHHWMFHPNQECRITFLFRDFRILHNFEHGHKYHATTLQLVDHP